MNGTVNEFLMTGMNRLSPLVTRRVGPTAAAASSSQQWQKREEQASVLLEDAKLFATGWAGGLIFFGTLLS